MSDKMVLIITIVLSVFALIGTFLHTHSRPPPSSSNTVYENPKSYDLPPFRVLTKDGRTATIFLKMSEHIDSRLELRIRNMVRLVAIETTPPQGYDITHLKTVINQRLTENGFPVDKVEWYWNSMTLEMTDGK